MAEHPDHSRASPPVRALLPASMPIPVPMTGAHQHGATMMIPQQAYPQQIPQAHMQPPLTYSPQALAMQTAPGYAANVGATQMTLDSSGQAGYGMVRYAPEEYIGVPPQWSLLD